MRGAAQAAVEMDRIWDAHDGWTVPEPGATEVAKAGLTYGACVGSLARHFASDAGGRLQLFAVAGKQHAVAHFGAGFRSVASAVGLVLCPRGFHAGCA